MAGRDVVAGALSCPICQWTTQWSNGIPDFGGGWRATAAPAVDAAGAHALLGLSGPGGWIALAGAAGALARELAELLPGVGIVAINPPEGFKSDPAVSVLLSGRWPIKTHALRGVLLGADADAWRDAAIASVLPGLRAAGFGAPPAADRGELLGSASGLWVVKAG
jgi:hypothetical protein